MKPPSKITTCHFCTRASVDVKPNHVRPLSLASMSAVVALSPYLSLPVVLFRDGVTQDVQETDVSRWGRGVSEHLGSNRRRGGRVRESNESKRPLSHTRPSLSQRRAAVSN